MNDLHFRTLTELSEQIRTRSISPVEVTRHLLDRISEIDRTLASFVTITAERALGQAAVAQEEISKGRWRGPLHGVPIAVKDLISTKGIRTTAGMSLYKDHVPSFDATVVERLDQAGAVLLGKLKTTEGALFCHHPSVTPPRNPWNTDYWSGVSSSGPGVAVERRRLVEQLAMIFRDIDALLTPTIPFPVPHLDSIDFNGMSIAGDSPGSLYSTSLRFTSLFNVAGYPAISFPAGCVSSGLPIGMQMVGSPLGEDLLLRAVHTLQKATDWHTRRSPVLGSRLSNLDRVRLLLNLPHFASL